MTPHDLHLPLFAPSARHQHGKEINDKSCQLLIPMAFVFLAVLCRVFLSIFSLVDFRF
jgi:hypothetical protein